MDQQLIPTRGATLPNEIIYYLAENHMSVRDIAHLRQTCHTIANLLEGTLYRADVSRLTKIELRELLYTGDDDSSNDQHSARLERHQHRPRISLTGPFDSPPSALHWAATYGSTLVAKAAIKAALQIAPQYIDSKDSSGFTPLAIAAVKGHIEVIQGLLNAGCLVDAPIFTWDTEVPAFFHLQPLWPVYEASQISSQVTLCPLTLAIAHQKEDAAILLAEHTGILDSWFHDEFTDMPLRLASAARLPRVVKYLLEQGYTSQYIDAEIPEALRSAVMVEDNTEVIDILIAHGEHLIPHEDLITPTDPETDFTAFFVAVQSRCFRNAIHLFQNHYPQQVGENLDYKYILAMAAWQDCAFPLMKILVEHFNAQGMFEEIQTTLLECINREDIPYMTANFVAELLAFGLNRSYLREGEGYLHWALLQPRPPFSVIDYLLKVNGYWFNINAEESRGYTPLDYAEYSAQLAHNRDPINNHYNERADIARSLIKYYNAKRGHGQGLIDITS